MQNPGVGSRTEGMGPKEPGLIDLLGEKLLLPAQGDGIHRAPGSILTVISFILFFMGSWSLVYKEFWPSDGGSFSREPSG